MVFKLNVSDMGKTFKLELESEFFIGKKIGDKISGREVLPDMGDYELEITGTSDKSGLPGKKEEEGPTLRRIMLTKGKFLRKTPHKGFRRRKTVRGNEISPAVVQINMNVVKKGAKPLEQIFSKGEKKEEDA